MKDSLEITLDGETYLNQAVTLNGSKASVSITLEGDEDANIKALTDTELLKQRS